ncbi:EAL domain-containing protein [Pseudomonas flexibilis]|nr:EAL domain-containing protein [Pseudomonas flexibilis]SCX78993.1 diguanylate cyclase/phosphodiesterase with PAS/PAC sensor(s) [Pseudomonas flexibilis]
MKMSFLSLPDWQRVARALLMVLLIGLSLAWLFSRADSISIEQHQDYSRQLLRLQQLDAELNASVLASRYDLYRNFDRSSQGVKDLLAITRTLTQLPDYLPLRDRQPLEEQVARLRQASLDKADAVDRFKRETAILRNSQSYFPLITDSLIRDGVLQPALSREVGIFGRSVMTFLLSDDPGRGERLRQEHDRLAGVAQRLPPATAETLRILLSHAALILTHKPTLDAITHDILELPTHALGDTLSQSYAQAYNQALQKARRYRVLLFVVALGLGIYLVMAVARRRRLAAQLADANRELHERLEALHQAQAELKRYATVFTNAREGMVITDASAQIIAVNPAFTEITGYPLEQIAGATPAVLSSGRQDEHYYQKMWSALKERGQWQGEIWNRRRSGDIYPEWLSIAAVRDSEGETTHYIGIFSDVTERKEAEARIHHLAHHDALTGLPNRLLLQDRLGQAIREARRKGSQVGILFMDLDRFKWINDTLGHDAGDHLLRTITRRCLDVLRESDTLARLGGDEFVAILPGLQQAQDAGLVARKLLAAITQPCMLGNHELSVTCSIGIAVFPGDGTTDSLLLRNADAAMYRAKSEGRNGFQFYSTDMNTARLGELLLEHQLRGALERQELCLFYQPKVDARDGTLRSCEALLRWRHAEEGLLTPDRFLPAAEESGLIVPIGEWVIREACRQVRSWLNAGRQPVRVAVNLSGQQFAHQNIVQLVRDALQEYRLPPQLLELELTETILMRDIERTLVILGELCALGVSLAIDDFGTGYSSLAYLRQFQVHTLKIDRSFVNDIQEGANDAKIASAVIGLAHSLGLRVVAEGVETPLQQAFLANHACDYLQGYLFGKPEPADRFSERLQRSRVMA